MFCHDHTLWIEAKNESISQDFIREQEFIK